MKKRCGVRKRYILIGLIILLIILSAILIIKEGVFEIVSDNGNVDLETGMAVIDLPPSELRESARKTGSLSIVAGSVKEIIGGE